MKRLNTIAELTAAIALLSLSGLMLINVVARNIVRKSFMGTETLAVYFMIWITFIGSAVLITQYGHVSVDFFLRMVRNNKAVLRLIGLLTSGMALVVSGYFVYYGSQLSYQLFIRGGKVATLGISQGYIYGFVTIAMALMFCNAVGLFWGLINDRESCYPDVSVHDDKPG